MISFSEDFKNKGFLENREELFSEKEVKDKQMNIHNIHQIIKGKQSEKRISQIW